MFIRLSVAAQAGLLSIALVTACLAPGCQANRDDAGSTVDAETGSAQATVASELGFVDQLSHGRAGRTDRIELAHHEIDDSDLQALSADDGWLGALLIDAGVVTDGGVESIALLPQLWHLRLRQSPIGDSGMERLATCRSIQILNVPQCDATADGVAALAELPDLRNLRLGGPRLAAETAAAVAKIKSLRNAHLIGVPIDDLGLRQIASLPKLQSLYLDDSTVTQEGWDWLFETRNDLHVHVNQRHLDRDGQHQDHQ